MTPQVIDVSKRTDPINVPPHVIKCPYCEGSLIVQVVEWVDDETGQDLWLAHGIEIYCLTELESEAVCDHTHLPYIYWLPADQVITRWLAGRYRFCLIDWQARLEEWNAAVASWYP